MVSWPAFSSIVMPAIRRSMSGSAASTPSAQALTGKPNAAIAAMEAPLRKTRREGRKAIMQSLILSANGPCLKGIGGDARTSSDHVGGPTLEAVFQPSLKAARIADHTIFLEWRM